MLAGEGKVLAAALRLLHAADAVVAAVIDGGGAAGLDGQAVLIREECVAHVVLGPARAGLAEVLGLSREETEGLGRLSGVRGEYTEMLLLRESKDAATARRGVVQVFCHPLEYWLFTSEPLRDVPYRRRMIEALGGDVWAAVKACAAGAEVPEVAVRIVPDADPDAAATEATTPRLELVR